jgi:hypothetical protein
MSLDEQVDLTLGGLTPVDLELRGWLSLALVHWTQVDLSREALSLAG